MGCEGKNFGYLARNVSVEGVEDKPWSGWVEKDDPVAGSINEETLNEAKNDIVYFPYITILDETQNVGEHERAKAVTRETAKELVVDAPLQPGR